MGAGPPHNHGKAVRRAHAAPVLKAFIFLPHIFAEEVGDFGL